ncbi:MAG: Carboxypeptidase regulatory-like domain [Candidatus Eremiobacteraeota bacterium]|nr:Carboxypeptidase regulatory-like domain [Candidatus Eremiobacteraeota bacterium]
MKRFAAVAIVAVASAGALLASPPVAAQGPAAIRGVVYDCVSGAPIAGASVELRNLVDGSTIKLAAHEDGRFVRVGIEPGRYLISATGPVLRGQPGLTLPSPTASRLARLENGDVLDVRIGTYRTLYRAAVERSQRSADTYDAAYASLPPPGPNEARPICDSAFVPAAPSTSTRYIIH